MVLVLGCVMQWSTELVVNCQPVDWVPSSTCRRICYSLGCRRNRRCVADAVVNACSDPSSGELCRGLIVKLVENLW